MRIVKTNQAGELTRGDAKAFGGTYSFWEKLKYKGSGSPRIIYEKGLEVFDAMDRGISGEISFVSFEILKNGLLLRLNQNQRSLCLGVKMTEIEEISLTGFRIEVREKKLGNLTVRIVHRGELTIREKEGPLTTFSVVVRDFEEIRSFFDKPVFTSKFNFSISLALPEKDYSYLFTLFN